MGWDGLGLIGLERMMVGRDVKSGWAVIGLSLGLGDCVWCVLLLETVANATFSSKSTPPVSHS